MSQRFKKLQRLSDFLGLLGFNMIFLVLDRLIYLGEDLGFWTIIIGIGIGLWKLV